MFGQPVYWRETMRPAKFLIFDSRAVLVLLPTLMHLRLWTLILAISTMFMFWYFERKGVSADSILRFARARLIGSKRSARGQFEERDAVDFGSFESREYLMRLIREEMARSVVPKVSFLARIGFAPRPELKPVDENNPVLTPVEINQMLALIPRELSLFGWCRQVMEPVLNSGLGFIRRKSRFKRVSLDKKQDSTVNDLKPDSGFRQVENPDSGKDGIDD